MYAKEIYCAIYYSYSLCQQAYFPIDYGYDTSLYTTNTNRISLVSLWAMAVTLPPKQKVPSSASLLPVTTPCLSLSFLICSVRFLAEKRQFPIGVTIVSYKGNRRSH